MEACCGAHEGARRFLPFGHTVKLMSPTFVAPHRKGGANDGNDAADLIGTKRTFGQVTASQITSAGQQASIRPARHDIQQEVSSGGQELMHGVYRSRRSNFWTLRAQTHTMSEETPPVSNLSRCPVLVTRHMSGLIEAAGASLGSLFRR